MAKLDREFYNRDALIVARELLGLEYILTRLWSMCMIRYIRNIYK